MSSSEERLPIYVQVTTSSPDWAPHFERCIKRGIATMSGSTSAVAFTAYDKSTVDIYVVTKPVNTEAGEQRGIAAAVVADVRSSPRPPEIVVVTTDPSRSGMAFICRAAVELFFEKIVAEVSDDESLTNPQPFDALDVDFPGFE